jgi:hypothetical protein
MTPEFVPLNRNGANGGPAQDFRVRVVASPKPAPAFVPAQEKLAHQHPPDLSGDPRVTLEKDGDRVTSIRIECVCGKIIVLNCEY